ncbi:MAG: D-TA family PLP-dependent enzyme [Planctomycetaceae bacterium]|nr:D-TA family PLP-dependent enzyme [Planctomycetaceae bacterium]
MDSRYHINDTSEIISPAVVVFRDIVRQNLDRMLEIAGDPSRLRPHCKTHKMPAVVQLQLERGIHKHKCATFAEAEMLADAGADDILLAYNLVGPNIHRAVEFVQKYPQVTFSCTADHPAPLQQLSEAMAAAGCTIDVLVDIDTGQHRTGLPAGDEAFSLYRQIVESEGLVPGGFHVYDGHQHQSDRDERRKAIAAEWKNVVALRDRLEAEGWPVPRLVAGGTASFPIHAENSDPAIELSPGTCVFHDVGYGGKFPDLDFTPAALLLTRVVSRPTASRLTTDLGYKAVASDPPAGSRVEFPDLPDAEQVLQNEEHLVLETDRAGEFAPGDELLGIPRHICPTSALHRQVYVVEGGEVVDRWDVTARDRQLTV